MEYNQQRRTRNSGYNSGRQMNYGRQMNCDGRQKDPGCEVERNMVARQTGCDNCARQMERESGSCQAQFNSCSYSGQRNDCSCQRTCTYMRQRGYLEEADSYPIGMSYTPWQKWKCIYDSHRGLMSGTIFPELDKPFCAAGRCGR